MKGYGLDEAQIHRILNGCMNPKYSPDHIKRHQDPPPRIPEELLCPIRGDFFINPVIASDNVTYEREAIEKWIAEKQRDIEMAEKELRDTEGTSQRARRVLDVGIKSPMKGVKMTTALRSNGEIKRKVSRWRERFY